MAYTGLRSRLKQLERPDRALLDVPIYVDPRDYGVAYGSDEHRAICERIRQETGRPTVRLFLEGEVLDPAKIRQEIAENVRF